MSAPNPSLLGAGNLLQAAIETVKEADGFNDCSWDEENRSYYWCRDPSSLNTLSTVDSFAVGNGNELYQDVLLPGLETAEHEVVLVTCFWAKSASLDRLSQSLRRLSETATSRNDGSKIRVSLGLSSLSLMQKLFHTSSPMGYEYPPATWTSKLGLPAPHELSGLDMTVKSLFFKPFSVMHPKFLIIDRQRAWMPSCNVSWESWYEGCVSFQGPIVERMLRFYEHIWRSGPDATTIAHEENPSISDLKAYGKPLRGLVIWKEAPISLLPSQHHASFNKALPLWFLTKQMYPMTPLNTVLMHLFSKARSSIEMITPNLTSPPVVDRLLDALARGVDVRVTTNRRMMVVEQVVTTLTVTEFWIWRLTRRYKHLQNRSHGRKRWTDGGPRLLEEAQSQPSIGRLTIRYFCPEAVGIRTDADALVKSHVKCTIFDESAMVLGSGNMDRASWYTSQELGVAISDSAVTHQIGEMLRAGLHGKTKQHFPPAT